MAVPTLGRAQVLIVPAFTGMEKAIKKDFLQPLEKSTIKKDPGQRIGDGVIGGLGKALKFGAGATIAGAASAVGTAMVKGFGRLKALEESRAKLEGLGHSAKAVDGIMQNALAAVKGTAFGMDEAASTAAGAVAAGIKPGKDLEEVLRLTGDAATIAGVGMGEMGAIFNKVATSNKIQGDVINQLNDKGIPIIQLLSKELNLSAEETAKLASKGAIDFDTFRRAMEEGVGGAAKKSGDTLQGAFKNTVAALGRIGANMLAPVYDLGKKFFNWAMQMLEPVEEWAKVAGEKVGAFLDRVVKGISGLWDLMVHGDFTSALGEAFDISDDDDIVAWLFDLRDGVKKVFDGVVAFGKWVAANKDWIGSIALGIAAGAAAFTTLSTAMATWKRVTELAKAAQAAFNAVLKANPVMLTISAIIALTTALVWFFTKTETGKKVWKNLTDFFNSHVMPVFRKIGGFFVKLWEDHLKPVFAALGDFFAAVWKNVLKPAIDAAVLGFRVMVLGIQRFWTTILKPVFAALGAFFKWVWETILSPAFKVARVGFHLLVLGIKTYWEKVLKPVFRALGDFFKWVWDTILSPAFKVARVGFRLLSLGIQTLWNTVLKPVFRAVGDFFKWVWDKILSPAFDAVSAGWSALQRGISKIWTEKLKPVFDAVGKFVKENVVQKVRDGAKLIESAWKKVANFFRKPINWVIRTVFNNGIVEGFNFVAGKLGMNDAKLSKIAEIPAYAKGGRYKGGLALVGEEGPELINFSRGGYVHTAAQSEKLVRSLNRDLTPEESRLTDGKRERDALLPAGGNWWDNTMRTIGDAGKKAMDWVKDGLVTVVDNLFLKPLKTVVTNSIPGGTWIGDMSKSMAGKLIDGLRDWVRGKEEENFSDDGGPIFKGSHLGKFARPANGPVTSHFGNRWGGIHSGIDLAVPIGTAIRAAWDGVVQKASWNALTGRTGMGMVLSHAKGWQTYYGHLSGWVKKVGDVVKAGTVIARSGNTGRSTGPHLHFETINRGRPVNPAHLFRDRGGDLPPGLNLVFNGRRHAETVLPATPAQVEAEFMRRGQNVYHIDARGQGQMTANDLVARIDFEQRRKAKGGVYA